VGSCFDKLSAGVPHPSPPRRWGGRRNNPSRRRGGSAPPRRRQGCSEHVATLKVPSSANGRQPGASRIAAARTSSASSKKNAVRPDTNACSLFVQAGWNYFCNLLSSGLEMYRLRLLTPGRQPRRRATGLCPGLASRRSANRHAGHDLWGAKLPAQRRARRGTRPPRPPRFLPKQDFCDRNIIIAPAPMRVP